MNGGVADVFIDFYVIFLSTPIRDRDAVSDHQLCWFVSRVWNHILRNDDASKGVAVKFSKSICMWELASYS